LFFLIFAGENMAKTKTSFKKGQSGNPKGKKPGTKGLPLVIKEARKVSQAEFLRTMFHYWNLTDEQRKKESHHDLSMGQIMVRKIYEMAGEGNTIAFKEILDRLYGQTNKKIEHTMPKPVVIEDLETGKAELLASEMRNADSDN